MGIGFEGLAWAGMVNERNIAVVVNVDDPMSIRVAKYYQEKRHIPERNIIRLHIGDATNVLSARKYKEIESQVLNRVDENIRAYLLTWSRPYRVGCMSITSAFSLGYDTRYCARTCRPTRKSEYFNFTDGKASDSHHIRPSMMLAADTFKQAKSLIDRGVKADYSRPVGHAYLLDTSDVQRNVRAVAYPAIKQAFSRLMNVDIVAADNIENKDDVLFYFTGVKNVGGLDSVHFIPGAAADHLTSFGGIPHDGSQMSSIKWLQAGATASYGSVVEPCNYLGKFPNPGVLIQHYLDGDTLLEAYWKSVLMPGQGVFIGEPLARPFGGCRLIASEAGRAVLINRNERFLPIRENTACDSGYRLMSRALH